MTTELSATSRPERKRQKRQAEFLDAARRLVAADGFEELTMSRLAAELDTVVSAVYRYFPSKGELLSALQLEALARLEHSLTDLVDRLSASLEPTLATEDRALTVLVGAGRWFCAASESLSNEMRLLQMIMSQRASALDAGGGERSMPAALALLAVAVEVINDAQVKGALRPGDSVDRAAMWAASISGVLQTDDLQRFVPQVFGGTRLAQLVNLDLIRGWGADPGRLDAASARVDRFAESQPLAQLVN